MSLPVLPEHSHLHRHRRHFPNWLILLIIALLLIALGLVGLREKTDWRQQFEQSWKRALPSVSPEASASAAASASPETQLSCVDETQINSLADGGSYALVSEESLPDQSGFICRYTGNSPVNGITPSIGYTLRQFPDAAGAQQQWQQLQQAASSKPGYRRYEEDPTLFAIVNPVVEVTQVTVYGTKDRWLIQLDYTPVHEAIGTALDTSKKLIGQVIKTVP